MKYNSLFIIMLLLGLTAGCKKNPLTPPGNTGSDTTSQNDTTSHNFIWETDTVGIYPSDLRGVWGTDINNVYAVGFIEYSYSPYTFTAIIHWDGEKWTSMDYQEGELNSIYGFSKDNIYAVGFWQVDYNQYSLIAHWDGVKWSTKKLQQYGRLEAVWGTSSSNLFAVGANGLILKYEGGNWYQQQSGTTLNLTDIWGFDDSHIFASGYADSSGTGVLLEYDGNSWSTVTVGGINPDSTTLYGTFRSIWGSSINKLNLVGSLSYEGAIGNWKLSDIPYNAPGINLQGLATMNCVRGSAYNNIFICGYYDLIIHWNGNNWFIYNQFFDKNKNSSLDGMWIKNKNVYIVGYENGISQAIIYRGSQ